MKKLEEYKSGEYIKMNDYNAFIPSKINYNWGWDDTKLDKLLAEANRQIGELNAYSLLIPNVDLYSPIENTDINGAEGKKKFAGSQEIANGDNIRLNNTDIL